VDQWRSIARYYNYDSGLSSELRSDAGLAVFQLIQLSMQSGPLKGSKPGYFKRCGANVAKMALDFLKEVVPHETLANCMGFSVKQMDAMNKWTLNAEKAVKNDKQPSKSIIKMQQQSKKARGKNKK